MTEKNYTGLQFRADRNLQARELIEMQTNAAKALRGVADVLFADGDITDGAACAVDAEGNCTLGAGGIYLAGMVRAVAAATLTVPIKGVVLVGIYLQRNVVTALQDKDLYDNDEDSQNKGAIGADRIKTTCTWGVKGDGKPGDFYPVWTVDDGVLIQREPAPQSAMVTRAIERYDYDSSGGSYVVRGLAATQLDDNDSAEQVYTIAAGAARVGGKAVESGISRRLVYAAKPDTMAVMAEPHSSATLALQRIAFDRYPVLQPATVRVQRRETVTLTHAPIVGAADPLPHNSVVKINSVKQGGVTYVQGTDYKLTASQVDWSPPGAEVGQGSKFDVDFEYISTEPVQDQTPTDFAIEGAVVDGVMYVDYEYALRRIDCIVIDASGALNVVKGVSAAWQPAAPSVPPGQLKLASIVQTWDARRRLVDDSVRVVAMDTLVAYRTRMDSLELSMAELRLATDVSGRYSGLKKGSFADPMLDNSMRDQGVPQTAVISGGALQLHDETTVQLLGDGTTTHSIAYTDVVALSQAAHSASMHIVPPAVDAAPPVALLASITLSPAVDRWEQAGTTSYPTDSYSVVGLNGSNKFEDQVGDNGQRFDASRIDTSKVYLRQIEVQFAVAGFKPGEMLQLLTFDGQPISALPLAGGTLAADAAGKLSGRFTVPDKIPVGTKQVDMMGRDGSHGSAMFTGSATLNIELGIKWTKWDNGAAFGGGSVVVTYVV